MPNWCDNMVTLRNADKSKVDALAASLEGEDKAFLNHLRPNPTGEWDYNWSIENWGTKWEAGIIDWERRDDNEVWVSFDSAWCPPTVIYEYLVEEGWEVEAIYHESGCAFIGQFTTDGGDDYYEYDLSDLDSIEELPADCIEFADLRTRAEDYIIDRLTEEWEDKERTEWYPVEVNPAYDGWYEVNVEGYEGHMYEQFAEFKNGEWGFWNMDVVRGWRGLAENPNEAEVD